MTSAHTEEVRAEMRAAAAELTAGSKLPINLASVRHRLKVACELGNFGGRHAQLVERGREEYVIVVPRWAIASAGNIRLARFLVAHELGHFLLRRMRVPLPLDERAYWIHEDICDNFAQCLLLPADLLNLSELAGDEMAHQALAALSSLTTAANVNWATGAFRLAQSIRSLEFIGVGHDSLPNSKKLIVQVSTLPRRVGIKSRVIESCGLWDGLMSMSPSSTAGLDGKLILEGMPWLGGAASGAAGRTNSGRFWHIAVSRIAGGNTNKEIP